MTSHDPLRRVIGARARRAPLALALLVALVFPVACANDGSSSSADTTAETGTHQLSGVVPEPVPDVSALSLPEASADATPFPFVAKPGQLLLVYFGYTACPDICPTTLADLKAAFKKLGSPLSKKVSLAMATIDPRRDTVDVISGYLHGFFPTATALRTEDDAALRSVTDAFGASYEAQYPNNSEPRVSHSAYLYVVDENGHVVLEWPFGSTSKDIALDLERLLA
ncbi:MAG: SCO family protein [Acidimicrobiales bacterium]